MTSVVLILRQKPSAFVFVSDVSFTADIVVKKLFVKSLYSTIRYDLSESVVFLRARFIVTNRQEKQPL